MPWYSSAPCLPPQVTGSHDHSLRLWERTDEPLILSEERENEREAEFEEAAVKDGEPVVSVCGGWRKRVGGWVVCMWSSSCCWSPQIPGETNQEVGLAGRKTLESVKAVSCQ